MTTYLTLGDVIRIVDALEAGPVRDVGLLDSATMRPRSSAFGEEAYPTLAEKAAALMHSLARNHALVDGNKRLAWTAAAVFLHVNGHVADIGEDDIFDLTMDVAKGLSDIQEIATRLHVGSVRPV